MSGRKSKTILAGRKKIAIFGVEPVTGKLGGLGIRQLEITRVLCRHFNVQLLTPFEIGSHKEKFLIKAIDYENPETWYSHIHWAEVVYTTHPGVARLAREKGKPVIVDLLVHEYFEDLERLPLNKMKPIETNVFFSDNIGRVTQELALGDFFLTPSERSRDYYLGMLTLMGKLRPQDYLSDPHFKTLIDIVPFGLSRKKPKSGKNFLRGHLPNVGENDFILIWGGALADWFDCMTPIRAMARLIKKQPRVKLVFIGNVHPALSEKTEAYCEAYSYAKKKGLLDKNVFFFSDWVPYSQRSYYLTEADAGIVTFRDHIENRFSQRIRLLDYLWGELPTFTNPGNVLSELVDSEKLGYLIPYGNYKALAESIEDLVNHPMEKRKIKDRIRRIKKDLTWEKVVEPIVRFCKKPKQTCSIFDEEINLELTRILNKESFSADQLIRQLPAHPYLRLTAARKKLDEGKRDEAAELLTQYLRRNFGKGLNNPIYRNFLLGQPGVFELKELESLLPPGRSMALLRFKNVLDCMELVEAEKLLIEEERLFGKCLEIIFCRGLLETQKKNFCDAAAHLEEVVREMPHRYELCLPLAEVMALMKRKDEAREYYVDVFERANNYGDEWLRTKAALGIADLESGLEYRTLEKFMSRDPLNEGLAYAVASAMEKAGKTKLARSSFEECVDSFSNPKIKAFAWFRLARLMTGKERKRALSACLELEPDHEGALKLIREFQKSI